MSITRWVRDLRELNPVALLDQTWGNLRLGVANRGNQFYTKRIVCRKTCSKSNRNGYLLRLVAGCCRCHTGPNTNAVSWNSDIMYALRSESVTLHSTSCQGTRRVAVVRCTAIYHRRWKDLRIETWRNRAGWIYLVELFCCTKSLATRFKDEHARVLVRYTAELLAGQINYRATHQQQHVAQRFIRSRMMGRNHFPGISYVS